jgi:hypothetical protein
MIMNFEEILKQIQNVSKKEIKRAVPSEINQIKEIILESNPRDVYEKMVLGYLTSICAEYMSPDSFILERNDLDYVGFELEGGNIEVETVGDMLGSCMKSGKIIVQKAGNETGKSMTGGEITAKEIKSIGSTIGGKISTEKADKISRYQGAEIIVKGARYKHSFIERILGK